MILIVTIVENRVILLLYVMNVSIQFVQFAILNIIKRNVKKLKDNFSRDSNILANVVFVEKWNKIQAVDV